jgi:hypothetical protein
MEAIYHQKNVTLACKTKSLEGPGQEAGHSRGRGGGEGLGEGRAEEEKRGSGVGKACKTWLLSRVDSSWHDPFMRFDVFVKLHRKFFHALEHMHQIDHEET